MESRFGLGLAIEKQAVVDPFPRPFVQPTVAIADPPDGHAIHVFAVGDDGFHDFAIYRGLLLEDLIGAAIRVGILFVRLPAGFRIPMLRPRNHIDVEFSQGKPESIIGD